MSEFNITYEERWENLTLANNFIFYIVMRHHPDACKHLIELLLGIKIDKIEMRGEETVSVDLTSHSIRLDVYVKDTDRIYDIEMQTINTYDLPERARYYQGVIDIDNLKPGEKYTKLKNSHIIFICLDDIFKNGLPFYTFENLCLEDNSIRLNDRAFKHFFIAENCVKITGNKEMQEFFEFLLSNKSSNGFTSDLGNYVEDAKHNTRWRQQYMTWERMQTYARDEGSLEKAIEIAENLLKMNLGTPEQIAQAVNLPLEQILSIKENLLAESAEK